MQLKAEAKVKWYTCFLALNVGLFMDVNIYENIYIKYLIKSMSFPSIAALQSYELSFHKI